MRIIFLFFGKNISEKNLLRSVFLQGILMPLVGVVGLGGNLLSVAVLSGAPYYVNWTFLPHFLDCFPWCPVLNQLNFSMKTCPLWKLFYGKLFIPLLLLVWSNTFQLLGPPQQIWIIIWIIFCLNIGSSSRELNFYLNNHLNYWVQLERWATRSTSC